MASGDYGCVIGQLTAAVYVALAVWEALSRQTKRVCELLQGRDKGSG